MELKYSKLKFHLKIKKKKFTYKELEFSRLEFQARNSS